MKYFVLRASILTVSLLVINFVVAQTKSKAVEDKTIIPQKTNQEIRVIELSSDVEPAKSTHGHLLMKEIPSQKNVSTKTDVNEGVAKGGIRGNEVIGEGQYLNYNKVIIEKSVTGEIPIGFPKHVKGQTPEQYKIVVMDWARNNKNLIKEEYHYEIK